MQIDKPANHLDQLIRQTRWHHAQLSMMADNKANMMLTAPAQVREIYTLGRYLARKKYRYVRYAYVTFTGGLLLSAAVFLAGQFATS